MTNQQKIRTRCPSCGFPSLFIDEAGHIVCSSIECKEPIVQKAIEALRAEITECDTLLGTCTGVRTSQRAGQVMDNLNEALKAVEAKHDYACRMDALAEERNIEIARLKAQRDRLAIDHRTILSARMPTGFADTALAERFGLRIVGGQVEEVK